ncbi:hypothetical protein [Algiphilus aromaticivorans]|uniref:hypothetical protein n=1 Tax=Algiphilus aromaticivorans TaxID=382454 RepID=UPI0012EC3A1C|nr:hypothetical protein [Algiphilus aromaticivorans]
MIWPARCWQPTANGGATSRPVTDQDDARRQAVEAEIQERRERRRQDAQHAAETPNA